MAKNDQLTKVLSTISTFDIKSDIVDSESKQKLVQLFSEFIMSEDPAVIEVLQRVIDNIKSILSNLGLDAKEPKEEKDVEELSKEPEDTQDISKEDLKALADSYKQSRKLIECANDYL